MSSESYSDGRAFAQAVKASAQASHPHAVQERIQQIWFDRFLSRVFASSAAHDWTLKGGVGLLARVTSGRGTRDIDFTVAHKPADAALEELQEIVRADLDDHLSFEMYRAGTMIEGQGEEVTGKRAYFIGYADGRELCRFHVDVVAAPPPLGEVGVFIPAGRAKLKHPVTSPDYRVFPVEDHLAEKVAAMLAHVRGAENTRVKDLVDILIIARTQEVNFPLMQRALDATLQRASASLPDEFTVPAMWQDAFQVVVRHTLIEGTSFDHAVAEVHDYLAPILPGTATSNAGRSPLI